MIYDYLAVTQLGDQAGYCNLAPALTGAIDRKECSLGRMLLKRKSWFSAVDDVCVYSAPSPYRQTVRLEGRIHQSNIKGLDGKAEAVYLENELLV